MLCRADVSTSDAPTDIEHTVPRVQRWLMEVGPGASCECRQNADRISASLDKGSLIVYAVGKVISSPVGTLAVQKRHGEPAQLVRLVDWARDYHASSERDGENGDATCSKILSGARKFCRWATDSCRLIDSFGGRWYEYRAAAGVDRVYVEEEDCAVDVTQQVVEDRESQKQAQAWVLAGQPTTRALSVLGRKD